MEYWIVVAFVCKNYMTAMLLLGNFVEFPSEVTIVSYCLCAGVGQVVLQVAAATPCKCAFGIEKSFWPAVYAKVTSSVFGVFFPVCFVLSVPVQVIA